MKIRFKVLVACEESQRVCAAFRALGAEAYSCDLIAPSGGHPEWHIKSDVQFLIGERDILFKTMDGKVHCIDYWDLLIAHPPCTRLCASGQRWYSFEGYDETKRKQLQRERELAIMFFMRFVYAPIKHIAIENPVGIMSTVYRKPDQIYNPYDFEGETTAKKTCLWLKNLPTLRPTQIIRPEDITHEIHLAKFNGKNYSWGTPECARLRAQTPAGVAMAMARQWITAL